MFPNKRSNKRNNSNKSWPNGDKVIVCGDSSDRLDSVGIGVRFRLTQSDSI